LNFSECLEQIAESARQKRLSLWVGGGISWPTLPLSNELKFYILERICDHSELRQLYEDRLRKEKDIGEDIKKYQLEAFIESISQINPQLVAKIAELFLGGFPNKNHFLIARLMEKGIVREVLTTNFDVLVERVLESIADNKGWREAVDYCVYSKEEQFERLQSELDLPTILKIHGSADNEESMRITLRGVASKTLSQKRIPVLEHFMKAGQGDVLVLGYGGEDDFDINPILSGIDSKKSIFYVDHNPGQRKTAELPKAFKGFHGRSILCDTKEVVDYFWRNVLKEDWTPLYDQWKKQSGRSDLPKKSWNVVIDEWACRVPLQVRLFITAWILFQIGWLNESHSLFSRAKPIFEKLGHRSGIASTLYQLGTIKQHQGRYDEAKTLHNQSLEIERKLGDQSGVAKSLNQLGIIEQHQGRYNEARALYDQSLEIRRRLRSIRNSASTASSSQHRISMG
jgi:tetratricopeptide (TPR) repeat protein